MTNKQKGNPQDQVEGYIESAIEQKNGVTMDKAPTDPENEKAYENATGMPEGERKDFEEEVEKDLG